METGNGLEKIEAFIARWEVAEASERSNAPLFLTELCDVLDLPHPDPAGDDNAYIFERDVTFRKHDGSTAPGRIDLYKRGCFVLEAKQGSEIGGAKIGHGRRGSPGWEQAMIKARNQADRYIRALPSDEGRPPFLLVTDIGHVIEVFAEFSRSGGTYLPFPAPGSHRISLSDLRKDEIRDRLRTLWTDPLALDPSRRAARVTREVADKLAKLALSLEKRGEDPHVVARFLMRCLFTMFAEDVNLLGKYGFQPFTRLLETIAEDPDSFVPMIEELWGKMNTGGYSTSVRLNLLQFNGGLFAEARALPLDKDQIRLLISSAKCDWRDVEPAIFGTLLERALDPVERHKLGAHYTPRAYVERLVLPTVIAPVREEWYAVVLAAVKHDNDGKRKDAIKELKAFHRRLCHLRILDPACGSGNFLYVTLEHLKRIEGEVLDTLQGFGETQSSLELAGESVDPHQHLGREINPRAADIAELVLWIGALQG
ncbi:MAG: class I SAM-dependent DNA methyltransferase, partial [Kiritimatiellae bacterium]|nr:class I SAM-dependent DNA methyltransferase [Kiritimatiellia bacterium]